MSKTTDWRPIATAPRDGRSVLTSQSAGHVPSPLRACFHNGEWCAEFDGHWLRFDPQPLYWRPLPSPEDLLKGRQSPGDREALAMSWSGLNPSAASKPHR